MILKLSTNLLPVVNVGMYQSRLSPDCIFEDWWLYDEYKSLSEEQREYVAEASNLYFNTKKYGTLVAKCAMKALSNFFTDISDKIHILLQEEHSMYNPKYYNFETDELNFEIEIVENEINKIISATKGNKAFFEWAHKTYKSYSGFISFMPYTEQEFTKAIKGKDLDRAVAMYLTYIFEKDVCKDKRDDDFFNPYQSDVIEWISYNCMLTEFVEDKEFHEILNGALA